MDCKTQLIPPLCARHIKMTRLRRAPRDCDRELVEVLGLPRARKTSGHLPSHMGMDGRRGRIL